MAPPKIINIVLASFAVLLNRPVKLFNLVENSKISRVYADFVTSFPRGCQTQFGGRDTNSACIVTVHSERLMSCYTTNSGLIHVAF